MYRSRRMGCSLACFLAVLVLQVQFIRGQLSQNLAWEGRSAVAEPAYKVGKISNTINSGVLPLTSPNTEKRVQKYDAEQNAFDKPWGVWNCGWILSRLFSQSKRKLRRKQRYKVVKISKQRFVPNFRLPVVQNHQEENYHLARDDFGATPAKKTYLTTIQCFLRSWFLFSNSVNFKCL